MTSMGCADEITTRPAHRSVQWPVVRKRKRGECSSYSHYFELTLHDGLSWNRLFDPRQSFVLVEWRRRGQCPFKGCCTHTPRIGARLTLSDEGMGNGGEKCDQAHGRDVCADRRDIIPIGKGVGI